MRIGLKDLEKTMDILREGYRSLPEDTEGMKERKYALLDLTDEVINELLSYGANNITMELVEQLLHETYAKASTPFDNRCHVYGWLTRELRKKYSPRRGGTF